GHGGGRRRRGEGRRIGGPGEVDDKVRAIRLLERALIGRLGLDEDRERQRRRARREQQHEPDDATLEPPAAKAGHRNPSWRPHHAAAFRAESSAILPSTSWTVRCATRSARYGSWVTSTIVWPARFISANRPRTAAPFTLSSAPVGSSARSTAGLLITARA